MSSAPSWGPYAEAGPTLGRGARLWRTWTVLSLAAGAGLRAWWLARTSFLRDPQAQARAEERLWAQEGHRLLRAAQRMGGLLIKVGQFLSARMDLFPPAFTEPLRQLQDMVPPEPWPMVERQLIQAYGPQLPPFASVEPQPLAAASLAQVHRARLRQGGEPVVVKVLRHGIRERVETDLAALRYVATWVSRHTAFGRRYDVEALAQEFAQVTRQELDMVGEAARAERFRAMWDDDPRVVVPRVYPHLTRNCCLVLEEVQGVRPDSAAALRAQGLDPAAVADLLLESFMRQWLTEGFFHADPHPGNLFVTREGRLAYVDFGMMAEIGPQDQQALRDLVAAILLRDARGAVGAMDRMGFLRPGADQQAVARAVALVLDTLLPAGERRSPVPPETLEEEIRQLLYAHPFQLPARYIFLGRAMGLLAGVTQALRPDEPFVPLLAFAARRELTRRYRSQEDEEESHWPWALMAYLWGEVPTDPFSQRSWLTQRLGAWARYRKLPGRLYTVLERLERGDPLAVDLSPLREVWRGQARQARRLSRAVLAAGAAVAGALLHGHGVGADVLWALAILLGLSAVR